MKQFVIQFNFEGKDYRADVTEIDGLDDVQYAVSPRDEELAERFRSNVFEKDKQDNQWHYDFPRAANGEAYMQAIISALNSVVK